MGIRALPSKKFQGVLRVMVTNECKHITTTAMNWIPKSFVTKFNIQVYTSLCFTQESPKYSVPRPAKCFVDSQALKQPRTLRSLQDATHQRTSSSSIQCINEFAIFRRKCKPSLFTMAPTSSRNKQGQTKPRNFLMALFCGKRKDNIVLLAFGKDKSSLIYRQWPALINVL